MSAPAASPWLADAERLHLRVAALLVAAACALALAPPSPSMQALLLLLGVALTGMPHGAFDPLVGERVLAARLGPRWWAIFGVAYLLLAGLVGLGWTLAPLFTLVLFLLASVLHFGLGDTEHARSGTWERIAGVVARGGLPVLLPIALHPSEVAPILAALGHVGPPAMELALQQVPWLVVPWGFCFAMWLGRAGADETHEALALVAAFVLLPPLLAFAIYFCLCHSVRHLLRLGAMLSPGSARLAWVRVLRVGVPATLLCLAGGWLLAQGGVETALVPLFQLLAALTVPHMAVTLLLGRLERDRAQRSTALA